MSRLNIFSDYIGLYMKCRKLTVPGGVDADGYV